MFVYYIKCVKFDFLSLRTLVCTKFKYLPQDGAHKKLNNLQVFTRRLIYKIVE